MRFPILAGVLPTLVFIAACSEEADIEQPFETMSAYDAVFNAGYDSNIVGCDTSASIVGDLLEIASPDRRGDNHWFGQHYSRVVNQLADGSVALTLKVDPASIASGDISGFLVEDCATLSSSLDVAACVDELENSDNPDTALCNGFAGSSGFTGACFVLPWEGDWDKSFVSGGGRAFSMPVRTGLIAVQGDCIYAEGHGKTKDGKNSKVSLFDVLVKGRVVGPEYVSGIYRANLESKYLNTRVGTDGDGGEWYLRRDKSLLE